MQIEDDRVVRAGDEVTYRQHHCLIAEAAEEPSETAPLAFVHDWCRPFGAGSRLKVGQINHAGFQGKGPPCWRQSVAEAKGEQREN